MKKYEENCMIVLKGGILKSYNFSDNFIKKNEKIFNDIGNIWDEIYSLDYCVYGANERHKENKELKEKICDILDILFDLNIKICNGCDNKIYKNKNSYRQYILEYGKEA